LQLLKRLNGGGGDEFGRFYGDATHLLLSDG
jgi:hypothetical protein